MSLLDAAWGLSRTDSTTEALKLVLEGLAQIVRIDAAAVLTFDATGTLAIAAQRGLAPAAQQLRFRPSEWARLDRAIGEDGPLRIRGSSEPDPYDGLLAGSSAHISPIHACVVAPLRIGTECVGLLTIDALRPEGLDALSSRDLSLSAALATAALRHGRSREEIATLRQGSARAPGVAHDDRGAASGIGLELLLGESAPMRRLRREIEVLAGLSTTVLIEGATGVGKELVAREIHARSPRARRPFVVVNCAALPTALIEAELFGHTRGAFTGAAFERRGKFVAAEGGTLLLDEIGELPLDAQATLLRALQDGEIQRVGDDHPRHVDVRVLCSTNRTLADEVAKGRFRADLYHRLAVYPIRVPALHERLEDLPSLITHFADAFAARVGARAEAMPAVDVERLARRAWPGNVRELKHAVERALLRGLMERGGLAGGSSLLTLAWDDPVDHAAAISAAQLDATSSSARSPIQEPTLERGEPLLDRLERVRRAAFVEALGAAHGNIAEAARRLGLSRSFAYREVVRLGLDAPRRSRR